MNYIVDIVLVALVALIAFISSKRGFIRTVLDLVSGIAAFIGARFLAPPVSVFLYDNVAKVPVTNFLDAKYASAGDSLAQVINNAAQTLDFLPEGVLAYIKEAGFLDGEVISAEILGSITTVEQIESVIVAPVVTAILQIIAFAVLAVVLLIGLRIAAVFISKIIKISKIADKINTILGGVFGILKGLVYVFIIAVVLCLLSFTSEEIAVYTADSYICQLTSTLIGI